MKQEQQETKDYLSQFDVPQSIIDIIFDYLNGLLTKQEFDEVLKLSDQDQRNWLDNYRTRVAS